MGSIRYTPVINFVDYSLNQGAPAGHESAETPIRHESNGAVAGSHEGKDCSYGKEIGKARNDEYARSASHLSTPLQAMPCAICLSYEHLGKSVLPFQPRGNVCHLDRTSLKHHKASNLKQAIVNLSKIVGDFVGAQEAINAQFNQRIDRMESTLNKRMDEMQNDMAQKFDNIQYSILRLTNLNTRQEKGNSPSQPYQNSMSIHEVEAQEDNLQW
ncbi:hypothetical protein AAG906_000922 [Vitis piasezkii]